MFPKDASNIQGMQGGQAKSISTTVDKTLRIKLRIINHPQHRVKDPLIILP
jgi:hypothetical protein